MKLKKFELTNYYDEQTYTDTRITKAMLNKKNICKTNFSLTDALKFHS